MYCTTNEIPQALQEEQPTFSFTTTTTTSEKPSTVETDSSVSEESNFSSFEGQEGDEDEDDEEMNHYFFFTPHTTNTDPSHKDPFYSQKTQIQESEEENSTEISPNDIPEVTEIISESSLEQSVEATEKTFTKTNSKLMDESVYKDALKLLSKITKEKSETTTKSYSEAKYRGNVEEPSSPVSQSTESLIGMDKIVYDKCKLFSGPQSRGGQRASF